MVFEIPNTTCL